MPAVEAHQHLFHHRSAIEWKGLTGEEDGKEEDEPDGRPLHGLDAALLVFLYLGIVH